LVVDGSCLDANKNCQSPGGTLRVRLECDDNGDCASGENCCLPVGGNGGTLKASCVKRACGDDPQVCDPRKTGECPTGKKCVFSTSLTPIGSSYGLCK
jgi:hypothetical protein